MSLADDPPSDRSAADRDQRRHVLLSPLTIISGRAQLLARMVRRSDSLPERERNTLLDGLTTIEAAVRLLVRRIDDLERQRPDVHVHDEARDARDRDDSGS